jgi:hypothetical protein
MGVFSGLYDLLCLHDKIQNPEQILKQIFEDPDDVPRCAAQVYSALGRY